jgi:hypothetical protein
MVLGRTDSYAAPCVRGRKHAVDGDNLIAAFECRIVVDRASLHGFAWHIVCYTPSGDVVARTSAETFRSMEDAYEAGCAELARTRRESKAG